MVTVRNRIPARFCWSSFSSQWTVSLPTESALPARRRSLLWRRKRSLSSPSRRRKLLFKRKSQSRRRSLSWRRRRRTTRRTTSKSVINLVYRVEECFVSEQNKENGRVYSINAKLYRKQNYLKWLNKRDHWDHWRSQKLQLENKRERKRDTCFTKGSNRWAILDLRLQVNDQFSNIAGRINHASSLQSIVR